MANKKGWRHTAEAKARIGAAARARGSAKIALVASILATKGKPSKISPETRRRMAEVSRVRMMGNTHARRIYANKEEAREALKKRNREKYAANKEIKLQKQREWALRNPEKSKAIKRRWYENNKDLINARQREKNKTPERKAFIRQYAPMHRANNPGMYTTYSENRRARELGAEGSHSEEEWAAVVERHGGRCIYCGELRRLSRDHDIPLARGGTNHIWNILPACSPCNSAKGTLTGDEFRQRLANDGKSMDERWALQLAAARESRLEKMRCSRPE